MYIQLGRPIVIENGSGKCKVGFSGEQAPRSYIPNLVGSPKYSNLAINLTKDCFIGQQALGKRGILKLTRPIQNGRIKDWNGITKVWHQCYQQLGVKACDQPAMMTQSSDSPKEDRQKATQIMFQQFGVPAFYMANESWLALHAVGSETGLVLDSGEQLTKVVPVLNAKILSEGIVVSPLAGASLTSEMKKLLLQSYETDYYEYEYIKQQVCYVAQDYEAELNVYRSSFSFHKMYQHPNRHAVAVGQPRIKSPEILFKPFLIDSPSLSMQQMCFQAFKKYDNPIRECLTQNLVLCGGNTMLQGFAPRLAKELKALLDQKAQIKIVAEQNRRYLPWLGGSILSSQTNFATKWITKAEYDEAGPLIVHKKCGCFGI